MKQRWSLNPVPTPATQRRSRPQLRNARAAADAVAEAGEAAGASRPRPPPNRRLHPLARRRRQASLLQSLSPKHRKFRPPCRLNPRSRQRPARRRALPMRSSGVKSAKTGRSDHSRPGARLLPPDAATFDPPLRRPLSRPSSKSTISSRLSAPPSRIWRKCWRPWNWPNGRRTPTRRRSRTSAAASANSSGPGKADHPTRGAENDCLPESRNWLRFSLSPAEWQRAGVRIPRAQISRIAPLNLVGTRWNVPATPTRFMERGRSGART